MIPCMASCAKVANHIYKARFATSTTQLEKSQERESSSDMQEKHTDTIDRMLGQFQTGGRGFASDNASKASHSDA
jgi:hypothetical protein